MKLIKEQFDFIKKEIEELKLKISNYKKYLAERKFGDGSDDEVLYSGDAMTESQINQDLTKLNNYQKLLENAICIDYVNSDTIEIGTTFKLKFDDSSDVLEYTLVETIIGNFMIDSLITTSSLLGQSLIGKKQNDKFSYTIKNNNSEYKIEGTIVEIEKSEAINTSVEYIRDIQKSHRKCENVEYLEKTVITESQRDLIKEELLSLKKETLSTLHDKIFINKRLNKLKRLLKEDITPLPNDDEIGFGTQFSIIIFDDDSIITKRVEMIDLAVSLETSDEYVERISPLGSAVFGLKNNDEFVFQTGKFHYVSGIVYDISNKKDDLKTNNPIIYQKRKGSLS